MQYLVLQPGITNDVERRFKLIMNASIIFINYYYTIGHNKINGGGKIQHTKQYATGNMSI